MRRELLPPAGRDPREWSSGDTVHDLLGFAYTVVYVNDDGSFAVDGVLDIGSGRTRYHYDAGESHPFRKFRSKK